MVVGVSVSLFCAMDASQDVLNGVGHACRPMIMSTTMTGASCRSLRASGQVFDPFQCAYPVLSARPLPPPTTIGYQLRVCTRRHVISALQDLTFVHDKKADFLLSPKYLHAGTPTHAHSTTANGFPLHPHRSCPRLASHGTGGRARLASWLHAGRRRRNGRDDERRRHVERGGRGPTSQGASLERWKDKVERKGG